MSEQQNDTVLPTQLAAPSETALPTVELPGAELVRQREARGLTILEVADQLNLAVRQIAALETDNYSALPGIAVVRGFIRAYAKLLKIDPAPLLATMPANPSSSFSEPMQQLRPLPQVQFSDTRLQGAGYGRNASKWYSVILLLVAIIGGAALAQRYDLLPSGLLAIASKMTSHLGWSGTDAPASPAHDRDVSTVNAASDSAPPDAAINPAGAAKTDGVLTENIALPATTSEFIAASASTPALSPVAGTAESPLALNAATALAKVAVTANLSNQLVLNLRDDSWIELRGLHNTVASKLYRAGATEVFDITEPVQLIVGNASGVDATLRGAPLLLQTSAKNNVARLNLK